MNYYWHGGTLAEDLKGIQHVEQLKFASAYFSKYGLKLLEELVLKHKLNKESVELFLSPLFSYQEPSKLLEAAKRIATVYIVDPIPFHSKVYWMKTKTNDIHVVFGSSNFTQGGFERNIEFDMIKAVTEEAERTKFKLFFDYCRNSAKRVNQDMIDSYRENEEDLRELARIEKRMKKKMLAHAHEEDPFDDDTYDLEGYFFQFPDYEAFFPRNHRRKDTNFLKFREHVKTKLMKIHDQLYISRIKPMGLFCHKRRENIVSSTAPNEYNFNKVTWLGTRYGKSPQEIDYLNEFSESKHDKFAFYKHACLQFAITENGFEVNLFHAVSKGSFDRSYVHDQFLNDPLYRDKLNAEINKLEGEGFVWEIFKTDAEPTRFYYIDGTETMDFASFYRQYDEEGRESFLSYTFEPNRIELRSFQSIVEAVIEKMRKLLPLYELMAHRVQGIGFYRE